MFGFVSTFNSLKTTTFAGAKKLTRLVKTSDKLYVTVNRLNIRRERDCNMPSIYLSY